MTGKLVKKNQEWIVEYDRGHEVLYYGLDSKSQEWSKKSDVKKFIKEGIEIEFDLVVTGFYDETKKYLVKEFSAKIKRVEHSTI